MMIVIERFYFFIYILKRLFKLRFNYLSKKIHEERERENLVNEVWVKINKFDFNLG